MEINQELFNQSIVTLANLNECFALKNALTRVPFFNGETPPLRAFCQDLCNAAAYVEPDQMEAFTTAVLGRFHGKARDSVCKKTIQTPDELIKHLKDHFAPAKNYFYYLNKLHGLQMTQGQSVGDFFGQINILLSETKAALKDIQTAAEDDAGRRANAAALENMCTPLNLAANDLFVKGLEAIMARAVDAAEPVTFAEAYETARRFDTRVEAKILRL